MERSREARRSNLTRSTKGLKRRRRRSSSLRDSPEDGEKEKQEKVRLRERGSKRDRDLLNRNKRRRRDKLLRRSNREGEESSEESSGEEDDYESEYSNRKISSPVRVLRQDPALKPPGEIIAVSVPRKARSASVKRSHEYWMTGNGGFREDQNHRRPSTSPARQSGDSELSSPSPSNVTVRKKMKANALETAFPKVSKPSSTVEEEDIEIEIAEVLFGLMQTQGCKEENSIGNSLQELESKDGNVTYHGNKPMVTSPASDSLIGVAQEKKKVEAEAENSAALVPVPLVAENSSSGISSPKSGKTSHDQDKGAHKTASVSLESRENSDSRPSLEEPNCVGRPETKEKSGSTEEDAKLDSDSTVTKATLTVSEVKSQGEEKFEIDLMAPPPMQSSPEKDGLTDLLFDSKEKAQDTEKMEALVNYGNKAVKKEVGLEEAEKKITSEKKETLKLDLERSHQLEQHGQKQQLPKASIPKMETTVQSSSAPMPITLAGWLNGLPPPSSYSLPFPTVAPNGSTGASPSIVLQSPHFLLPQPRPKRCATHHYIARNIHLHQQLAKTNPFWPATSGSATVCGANCNNFNILPSPENFIMGNPLQGTFPVLNRNSTEEKSQVVANFPDLTKKDKSTESTNVMDTGTAQRKQILIQQASQPASSCNLMHGPGYVFLPSQHQTMTTANPSGSSKCATSTNKASLSAGISAGSMSLPGAAAAVSVNYPNLGSKEAPYLTMLQNNGYALAMSTPLGNPPVTRGGAPAQAFPFLNGPFYSSQQFHSHLQQQQPHSQPFVQSTYQNANTSSGSSSLKQQEKNQRRGAQGSGEKFLIPRSVNPQQLQNYQMLPSVQSRKLEAEMSGENTAFDAGSRTSHMQESVYGQNSSHPQPLNFELVPSTKVGNNSGSGGGNLNEKQQSQHKSMKGGVEIIPYQALAMSFTSFPGNSITSKFNFSSVAQNPAVFHSFTDKAKQQYQVAPLPNATEQKNNQISDVNNWTGSTNLDGKKAVLGKPQAMNGQTPFFDNSARTLNFVPSPIIGNWPPHTISPTAATASPHVVINSPNSHQQHQQQPVAAAQSKARTANSLPASSMAAKFSNNDAIFPQALAQCNSSIQSTQASLVHPISHSTTKFATHKNLPQQSRHGQMQISFGGNPKSTISPEVTTCSHVASPLTASSPSSGGNLRTSSTSSKGGSSIPTLQSQQSENSSTGTGQKSSPVCGRNVPSILSTCPSHLSELRY